jgi:hypothetical protein
MERRHPLINRRPHILPNNIQHYHQAIIVNKGNVISYGHNSVGTRSRGCGFSDMSLHAERAVVKNLGDISQLRGSTLIVYRYNSLGELRDSKPCSDCQIFLEKCIKKYGLRKARKAPQFSKR